ncbi:MAG: CAP domain-containing protein, partial [Nitrososphaera sp.]|nr:CAP domain-containing protein [Nitrososphaera sp.]
KIAVGAGVGMAIVAIVLLIPAVSLVLQKAVVDEVPPINILPPIRQEPEVIPQDELVRHALEMINTDRAAFGLQPVRLSENQAAQIHAEDVFRNKQISHWMSNGEKPYMTYTRYGGSGSVSQNVAIAGFNAAQYNQCLNNSLYDCEKIEPIATIEELEYEMMYKDKECCDDGHRKNILNEHHTHVSIGIVYDEYYLALVQNFENNYGLQVSADGRYGRLTGELSSGEIDHVAIYYDVIPDSEIYEQNKRLLSYSLGELVASVVKPLPPGYYYQQPRGYSLIVADIWDVTENNYVDITFDLARAVTADGVYTVSAVAKDGDDGETFEVTSYSIFVDSEVS